MVGFKTGAKFDFNTLIRKCWGHTTPHSCADVTFRLVTDKTYLTSVGWFFNCTEQWTVLDALPISEPDLKRKPWFLPVGWEGVGHGVKRLFPISFLNKAIRLRNSLFSEALLYKIIFVALRNLLGHLAANSFLFWEQILHWASMGGVPLSIYTRQYSFRNPEGLIKWLWSELKTVYTVGKALKGFKEISLYSRKFKSSLAVESNCENYY